jgi:REP element-mobilizing transposase RayT
MRQLRILGQGVWYEIRTRINNREALFRHANALALFARVFRETGLRFVFEVRGLRLEDDWLTFYIKPEDGFELPEIMKWMKQVFAQRYNAMTGRIGHIWGDRYWSRILEGEPPEVTEGGGGTGGSAVGDSPHRRGEASGVRPCWRRREGNSCFSLIFPFSSAPPPG